MLAYAPHPESLQPGRTDQAVAARRGMPSPAMAALAAVFAILLIAAGALAVHVLVQGLSSADCLPCQLAWIAGLLAAALVLGGVLAAWALRQQARDRRAGEAQAREHALSLRRARDEALTASHAATQCLMQLGHELRTPLNAIIGFAQLLEIHPQQALAAAPQQWVEGMTEAAWHVQAIAEDLQDAGRASQGSVKLKSLDVEPVIAEALRMVQLQADRAGVRLSRAVSSGLPALAMADSLRLRQVLLNLLTNAIKYGRRGGHVRVEIQTGAQWVQMQVIDNGIGMDRSQLAHLFEPFNRLGREHGAVSGSGIGLSLVRQWMQRMNGGIRVESQFGIGTTVHLLLPATPEKVQP